MAKRVVAVEGGPCSGKTTFLNYCAQEAQARGVRLAVLPEVASGRIAALAREGVNLAQYLADRDNRLRFQAGVLGMIVTRLQGALDDDTNDTILADRLDIGAYLNDEDHGAVLEQLGLPRSPIHEADTVIFLPTLAKTDPGKYLELMATNPARYETVEQARATCDKNFDAIKDHPDVWVLPYDIERRLRYAANITLRGAAGSLVPA